MTTIIRGTSNDAAAPAFTGDDGDTGLLFPSTGNWALACDGNSVLDATSAQVVARQTTYVIDDGVPFIVRATDSNAYKIGLQETAGGTPRAYLGASSTNALMVADGAAANVLNVTAAGVLQTNSGYGSVANSYSVRAWVNFNGVSTISRSGGVSSVTNGGTGNYTVNFSFTMPDIYYAPVFFSDANSGIAIAQPTSASTTSVTFTTRNGAGTYFNGTYAGCVIVR